jgi:hypothetical protein
MAKQTFTTGQVLTAAQMTSLQQTAMLGGDTTAKTTSYVLVAADAGTVVAMNASGATTITVNTGLFAAGDIVTIQNRGSGTCTVTAGTATVNTSGSLVLAQYQGGVLYFNSASAAVFYQFATPASGDIEGVTAGTGISGGGTSGTVTITNSMATAIDAKGDLIVGTGADTFARLAVGTNGHTLVADSSETTGLKWAAAGGGGKVLQVVSATTTTQANSTSTTFVSTGLFTSITPSATTSKVLILCNTTVGRSNTTGNRPSFRLQRDATTVLTHTNALFPDGQSFELIAGYSAIYLDSPSTTSSTTYTLEFRNEGGGSSVFVQNNSNTGSIILMEIGV